MGWLAIADKTDTILTNHLDRAVTMQQITLDLSDDLLLYIQQQIEQGVFNDINEYLLYLLNQDKAQRQSLELEKMLIEGLDSGEMIEVTEDWWETKRQKFK